MTLDPKADPYNVSKTTMVTSRDGTTIHVQAKGNYLAPHIIFAPGFATSLAYYDLLFDDPLMFTQLYMVRYDPRGHGLSGKPQTPEFYTSDRYADDLKAIIEEFHLENPFFAGWSVAGTIITDIAANFPHPLPFSGVISLAGLLYFDIQKIADVAKPSAINLLGGLTSTDTSTGLQARIDFINAFSEDPDVPFTTKSAWVGAAAYLLPSIAALVSGRAQDTTRLKEEGKAGWPLLTLIASEDKLLNAEFMISTTQAIFKNHEIKTIEGAGHIVFYDREKEVAHHILSFVNRVTQRKSYPTLRSRF